MTFWINFFAALLIPAIAVITPSKRENLLAAADKDAELMTWFQNQVVGAREKFSKYMRFDKA